MSQSDEFFSAPWDRKLLRVTLLVALVCLGITASLWPVISNAGMGSIHFWGGLLPTLIALVCAGLAVKGYRLEDDNLVVERQLWASRFALADLQSVQPEPQLLDQSNSTLGNSGFFGFMGLFRHPQLGPFRALVTDPGQLLLLRFGRRSVAISPADQQRFLALLQERQPAAQQLPSQLGAG